MYLDSAGGDRLRNDLGRTWHVIASIRAALDGDSGSSLTAPAEQVLTERRLDLGNEAAAIVEALKNSLRAGITLRPFA